MRWKLVVLLALWVGTLAPPLHAPPFKEPTTRSRPDHLQAGLVLQPPTLEVEGCNGLPQAHTFQLINNSGAAGTFDLDYLVSGGDGTLTGPAQLSLGDGQAADLAVTLTPGLCAAPGKTVRGHIEVSGNGQTTAAEITQVVYVAPRWEMAREHPHACSNWLVETAIDPGDGQEYMYVAGCDTRSTYRYDPRRDTWSTLAATLPAELVAAGDGVAYQGRIYARSDGQGSQTQRLYIYDVAADAWSSRAVLVGVDDRLYYEAVELGGQIYFLGGQLALSGKISAAVDRYDPATGTWSQAAPMLHARALAMSWVHLEKIYVAGGRNADGPLSSTEVYDPASNTWTEDPALFAPLPAPRYGGGDAILDGQLWLTGGFDTTDLHETLYWSAADNTWHPGFSLAGAASYVESTVLAGQIYAVGGVQGGVRLDYNQRLVVCPDRSGCQGWLQGQVYDAELTSNVPTCTAASLSLTPGSSVAVDPATGHYGPLPLLPGAYLLEASAPGYSLEPTEVSVEHGITTTRNIGLWRPRVQTGPTRFQVVSSPGTSLTVPLWVTNTGHLALEYQLLELAPGDELPWLRAGPTVGEIAPSQAATVELTFECTAAQDGQILTGTLGLVHGDPCVSPIEMVLEFACKDRGNTVYLPLLLQGGDPALAGSAGRFRRKGTLQPVVPARTRP